jgi:hypothetical protein
MAPSSLFLLMDARVKPAHDEKTKSRELQS